MSNLLLFVFLMEKFGQEIVQILSGISKLETIVGIINELNGYMNIMRTRGLDHS